MAGLVPAVDADPQPQRPVIRARPGADARDERGHDARESRA